MSLSDVCAMVLPFCIGTTMWFIGVFSMVDKLSHTRGRDTGISPFGWFWFLSGTIFVGGGFSLSLLILLNNLGYI